MWGTASLKMKEDESQIFRCTKWLLFIFFLSAGALGVVDTKLKACSVSSYSFPKLLCISSWEGLPQKCRLNISCTSTALKPCRISWELHLSFCCECCLKLTSTGRVTPSFSMCSSHCGGQESENCAAGEGYTIVSTTCMQRIQCRQSLVVFFNMAPNCVFPAGISKSYSHEIPGHSKDVK